MSDAPWDDRIRASLAQVVDEGRWRSPREFDALGPSGLLEGGPVVSFASNDYLGLSSHPAVVGAARAALDHEERALEPGRHPPDPGRVGQGSGLVATTAEVLASGGLAAPAGCRRVGPGQCSGCSAAGACCLRRGHPAAMC